MSYIIKPERGVDFYVYWSGASDGPGWRGTRVEMTSWITAEGADRLKLERAFDRADHNGSSLRAPRDGWWDDDGLITRWTHDGEHEVGDRWLPRENLAEWLRTGNEALLEPIAGP